MLKSKKYLKTLIQEDRIDKVIEIMLSNAIDDESYNALIQQASRYKRIKKDKVLGVTSSDELDKKLNEISNNLISLIDDFEMHDEKPELRLFFFKKKYVIHLLLTGIILCFTYLFIRNSFHLFPNSNLPDREANNEEKYEDTSTINENSVNFDSPSPIKNSSINEEYNDREDLSEEKEGSTINEIEKPAKFFFKYYEGPIAQTENLIWTAQNISVFIPGESWKIREGVDEKFGLLYSWNGASKACERIGGRLPTSSDWNELAKNDISNTNFLLEMEKFGIVFGGKRRKNEKILEFDRNGYYWVDGKKTEKIFEYIVFSKPYPFFTFNSTYPYWGFSCKCVLNK